MSNQYRQQPDSKHPSYGTSQAPYPGYTYQMPTGYQSPYGGLQVPAMPSAPTTSIPIPGMLPVEQSYIENILRLNKGKVATIYMSFEKATQPTVFKGTLEAAGRDHIIISESPTGKRYLLLMVYLDYITFDEPLEYNYPYAGASSQLAQYSPR